MAGLYFGATIDSVLTRVQNTSTDPDSLGGEAYIFSLMAESQADITGMMPRKIAQPLQVGEVWGHILVDSANDGQETIDATQTVPQDSSNWHVFIDYSGCQCPPPNNKGYEATISVDYTISAGVPDFAVKPLTLGSRVLANYYTDWSDNVGLEALRGMVEEDVALQLLSNAGMANNPNLLDNITDRKKDLKTSKGMLRKGEMVPMGLEQLNLLQEVEVNDESKQASVFSMNRNG